MNKLTDVKKRVAYKMLKKFVNDSSSVVEDMIEGFVETFPYFYEKHPSVNSVIYRRRRRNKVALVVGGGSGHEPLFIGFVGKGLADAAVCGNLYNAPDPESVYQTAKAVETGKGVLFLYGTYPGDKMNFDIAEERLNAEGIAARHICVHDDITSAPVTKKVERRGIAGDVFMFRIVGAACDAGLGIDEIVRLAEIANNKIWSIGAAITQKWGGYLQAGKDTQNDGTEYIEYGIGLHGERGILRTKLPPVNQLVNKMYDQFMDEIELVKGDEICVLVNGLGSISIMELAIVFHRVKNLLTGDGFRLYDADINNYCSSYQSDGFSITLFKIDNELKKYYDAPCYSPYYFHKVGNYKDTSRQPLPLVSLTENHAKRSAACHYVSAPKVTGPIMELDVLLLRDMMMHIADRLIASEDYLSELDSIIGDGDHGICIASGMKKIKCRLMKITEENTPYEVCQIMGKTMLLVVGGASGAFFGSMYMSAAESMKDKSQITVADFAEMWDAALTAIQKKGGAHRGDKTLIDALAPAVDALTAHTDANFLEALTAAEKAAEEGMRNTQNMTAKFGRGKFLSDRALGCQDAGATTIWITFKSMREYVTPSELCEL